MESNRLVNIGIIISKIYLIVVSAGFLLVMIFSYFWYVDDGAITDFCIHVPVESGEYYHFRVSEHNACLIDWWPFLYEAILFPVIFYIILFAPVFILWLFLRCKNISSQK